jgi:hypothetical protein
MALDLSSLIVAAALPADAVIAAEFYKSRTGATLVFNRIHNGQRTQLTEVPVADKREARRLAVANGATPWNF